MMLGTQAPAEEAEAIRGWFATLHGCVDAVDFTAARTLFDESAIGFGTFMDIVEGLDDIEQQQWRAIWPSIGGFRFHLDTLRAGVSGGRRARTRRASPGRASRRISRSTPARRRYPMATSRTPASGRR